MINVRRGRTSDYDEISRLLDVVWGEDDYVKELWPMWVNEPDKGIVLVAEHAGKIAGTSYVNFMPHNTCWLQALRVHPEHRRMGVGSVLTKTSLEEARTHKKQYAYLGIDGDNTASLTLTARSGFTKISEYTRLLKKLPAVEGREVSYPACWRRAVVDDLDPMLKLGEAQYRKELIACWQWQPFAKEAIQENIVNNHLWGWDEDGLSVWAGFEDFEAHPHLFDPCGSPEDVKRTITTLSQHLTRNEEATFEVWLHRSNPLIQELISELEFVPEEGYTIWEYKLQ